MKATQEKDKTRYRATAKQEVQIRVENPDEEDDDFKEVPMHGPIDRENQDEGASQPLDIPGIHFEGNEKNNPDYVAERMRNFDTRLHADTTTRGCCRRYIITGSYRTIYRLTPLIIFLDLIMITAITFLATYERVEKLDTAFIFAISIPSAVAAIIWVMEYCRAISHETRHFESRISEYFISEGQLGCLDICWFTLYITLFAILVCVCIAFIAKCDTPGTWCFTADQWLLNGKNSQSP